MKKYSDGTIVSHTVNIVGMGESIVAEKVEDMFDRENPTVAPYDKSGEVQLRITAKAATQAEADRLCAPVIREICDRLGDVVYGTDMNKIEERVVSLLRERGKNSHRRVVHCGHAPQETDGYPRLVRGFRVRNSQLFQ